MRALLTDHHYTDRFETYVGTRWFQYCVRRRGVSAELAARPEFDQMPNALRGCFRVPERNVFQKYVVQSLQYTVYQYEANQPGGGSPNEQRRHYFTHARGFGRQYGQDKSGTRYAWGDRHQTL